jgi:four helix bundle protein
VQKVQWVQEAWFQGFKKVRETRRSGSEDARHRHCSSAGVPGVQSHEDLVVWQLATELKRGVYALICSGPLARDRELSDQLRRASASAPRNIAEGFGRYLPGPFVQSLRIANGERREIQDAPSDACDRGYLTRDQIVPLRRLSMRTAKAIAGLLRYLQRATPPKNCSS